MAEARHEDIKKLETLAHKAMRHCRDASGVECRVFAPMSPGQPFVVEFTKERFVRRVSVDGIALRRLADTGRPEVGLLRDLQLAVLAVARLSEKRK